MFELPTVRITVPSQPQHQRSPPPPLPPPPSSSATMAANEENHIDPKFDIALNTNNTSKLNTAEMNEYLLCSKLAGTKNDPTNMTTATSHSQRNLKKISQLKESHSALVKILESAPINSNKLNKTKNKNHYNNNDTNTNTSTSSSSSIAAAVAVAAASAAAASAAAASANIISNNSISNHHGLHHHHHHRKRNKHLIEMHCDDLDKSSDDEMGCNSNSSASSNASEAEIICPWKKTRIAREWQQQPSHHNAMSQSHEKFQEFNDDDGEEDDNNSLCDCYNTWRRSSSDSNESIQNNDSGCDSDCPENITELCKKFDENLSEQDVIISFNLLLLFHHSFDIIV